MDHLTMHLYYGKYETDEEKIRACKAALTLWATLIYDGNYQFYHCRIMMIYSVMAQCYAQLKKGEETIETLKKALHHAKCFDAIHAGKYRYTSVFVNAAFFNTDTYGKAYTSTSREKVYKFMQNESYDFVRDDPAFVEFADNCK